MNISLPQMSGSEKQVAWADQIRNQFFDGKMPAVRVKMVWDERSSYPALASLTMDQYKPLVAKAIRQILLQKEATWWIDNRDSLTSALAHVVEGLVTGEEEETELEKFLREGTGLTPEQNEREARDHDLRAEQQRADSEARMAARQAPCRCVRDEGGSIVFRYDDCPKHSHQVA